MRAIRVREFGPPEVLCLEDVRETDPGPGQVLIEVHAAGVNPVESYIRSGGYASAPELPYTPGSDAAGIAVAVGDGVGRVSVGDRVFTTGSLTGTYAELALCAEDQLFILPEQLSFAQGAAIGVPATTAWRALFQRARARAGETVLIHGASGGVGSAAVQLAVAAGLTVVGTAGSEHGRTLVAELGAAHTLDHTDPDHFDAVRDLTDGRGADVIIEMLANENLSRDLDILAPRGRVIVVGSRGPVEIDPRALMRGDGTIVGMLLFNALAEELLEAHESLAALLADGVFAPVAGREFALAEAARAHHAVIDGPARGKIVLTP